ncbi:MAG TPA: HEAT repeat domain-containing protein, partial [Polyangiaceae bacterium]|nr:HEAT repeat domain-containing protein [Polyangiaceae bacterium]
MQEQTNGERWEHLRPESWGGTGLPLEQARELDERIRKEGAKAFPLLKQAVEDDAAEAALRHRAMEWLVTLYGNRDLDSKAVVESLMKVARTALRGDRRELRRDALMALGRLHRKSWEGVPEALDLLLALAADESSSQGVREDALLALAETGSPKAIAALALGILEGAWALVRGLHDIQTAQWMDKATVFVDLIEKHPITRS